MAEKNFHLFSDIVDVSEKVELANVLVGELANYSIYDIMKISGWLDREICLLPPPYREKSRPYFVEQLFGRQRKIMEMRSKGDLQRLVGQVEHLNLYTEFCKAESRRLGAICSSGNDGRDKHEMYGPFHSLYYLLLSCFYMFVLGEPGHPVGMPFPGGFAVRRCGGVYFCPIRDKEKDVEYSICNFCPAQQDEDNR